MPQVRVAGVAAVNPEIRLIYTACIWTLAFGFCLAFWAGLGLTIWLVVR